MKVIKGNIFTSKAQTIVNTVNTVGVMGAGIALEFRLRYPDMYEKYIKLCNDSLIEIGKLWLYKSSKRWILNFPTKEHWKFDTKPEYLEKGLEKFVNSYKTKQITSIAFPLLGTKNGKLSTDLALKIMYQYLSKIDIPVEVYQYDDNANDDIYLIIKNYIMDLGIDNIKKETGLQQQYLQKLVDEFRNDTNKSISKLLTVKGIGIKTFEKLFVHLIKNSVI